MCSQFLRSTSPNSTATLSCKASEREKQNQKRLSTGELISQQDCLLLAYYALADAFRKSLRHKKADFRVNNASAAAQSSAESIK
jgi:hypothetical protein